VTLNEHRFSALALLFGGYPSLRLPAPATRRCCHAAWTLPCAACFLVTSGARRLALRLPLRAAATGRSLDGWFASLR